MHYLSIPPTPQLRLFSTVFQLIFNFRLPCAMPTLAAACLRVIAKYATTRRARIAAQTGLVTLFLQVRVRDFARFSHKPRLL
jgi:hypothetical protein